MIVALDGPAAAGKGTLARRLAEHLDLAVLDTGRLYRATGARVLRLGGDPADDETAVRAARSLEVADFDDPALRGDEVAAAASKVAALAPVRAELLKFQRDFAASPPDGKSGAVLDGRDIGTVVCPAADAKIFLTASLEVRAARRVKELRARGVEVIDSRVLRDMKARDEKDGSRGISPLKPASDAFVLDTDKLDADAVFARALAFIVSRNEKHG